MTIIDDRLAAFDQLTLGHGDHRTFEDGVCAMEAAAWLAGEKHSDQPSCVSPVIAAFMRQWNDTLDDGARNRLLKPLIPLTIGTRTTDEDEETRAWMATDWSARELAQGFLRLAGLTEQAEALESLASLSGRESAVAAQPTLDTVRKDAAAAGDALAPTVTALQDSAVLLVKRMCEVGR